MVLSVLAELRGVLAGEAVLFPEGGRRDERAHPGGQGHRPEGPNPSLTQLVDHTDTRNSRALTKMADTLHL